MIIPTARIHARSRRGSVYMLVLGMGSMLTVIGLAVAVAGRVNSRNAAADRDLESAALMAQGAVDLGMATINADATWRGNFGNNVWRGAQSVGRGAATWRQTDDADNDIADSPDETVRISGMATIGLATRKYSLTAKPGGTRPLPVLSTALHSTTGIAVTSSLAASGGTVSTNGTLNNQSTITGNVEAGSLVNSGSIVGFVTQPAPAKSVPGDAVFSMYQARATEIQYSDMAGKIRDKILTAANNPWGPQNAAGIYYIRVPTNKTLELRDCIIRATLIVELVGSGEIDMRDKVAWDPPSASCPSLIAKGSSSAKVTLRSTTGTVNIPILGVNILGLPIVIGTAASAPSEQHGLFHVMGGAPTLFQDSPRIVGTWIGDGSIGVTGATRIIADPNLAANPPEGYTMIDATITAVPGTFRWETR